MTYRKNCNIETTVRILSLDKPPHSRAIVVLSTIRRSSDLESSVLLLPRCNSRLPPSLHCGAALGGGDGV